MKYLSVCSGIEAASVAWHNLGWEPVGFSEIEPFPSAVLAHRFPNVPNLGDMTKFKEWPIAAGSFQLLVGGTPCQAFSVAGLRKGLEDPRGNLMLTFGAIAGHFKPTWIVWENVPGVLSSGGGRDFGSFLGMLAELGYGFAYRVLDAQFYGVAQRRRRVFVVGYLGDWRRAAEVLFESESLSGYPPPSREAGEGPARGPAIGIDEECNAGDDLFGPLLRGGQGGTRQAVAYYESHPADSRVSGPHGTAGAVAAKYGTGGGNTPLVAHAIQAGALRENPASGPDGVGVQKDVAYTLEARAEVQAVAMCLNAKGGSGRLDSESETLIPMGFNARQDPDSWIERTGPLDTDGGTQAVMVDLRTERFTCWTCGRKFGIDDYKRNPTCPNCGSMECDDACEGVTERDVRIMRIANGVEPLPFDTTQVTSKANYSNPKPGDPCHPLAAGAHPPAVAFDLRGREGGSQFEGPHDTVNIRAASGGSSRSYVAGPAVARSLTARMDGSPCADRGPEMISFGTAVRRLTPRECERLQGFPDDWTLIPMGKKWAKDGPRYKACGNSMAVPVMGKIGQRIEMVCASSPSASLEET